MQYRKVICQGMILFLLFMCGVILIFSPSFSLAQNPVVREGSELIQVKAENGLLSVKLENARIQQVIQEIARQTGVNFEGWENAQGVVTQQFDNLPLDEGLRKISQSFVMVLKKTGEEGKPLRVEKVIIIAQKGPSSSDSASSGPALPQSKPSEKAVSPAPPPSPPPQEAGVVQPTPGDRPKETALPAEQGISSNVPSQEPAQTQQGNPPEPEQENKEENTVLTPEPESLKSAEGTPKAKSTGKGKNKKKKSSTAKTASVSSSSGSSNKARGEEFFRQKRWDKVVVYFGKYLEQNPSDQEIQEKLEIAKQNAEQAISLYRQGRKLEDAQDFAGAYESYKKSCDIYPVLFDAWERMKATERKK
ncbi:MAG: hypothetical protein AB1611_10935 [bacterium]